MTMPRIPGLVLTVALLLGAAANGMAQSTQTFWWNDRVFCEIFVRSFHDSNGDGIGDFQGIIQKLDYLNDGNPATTSDLGVTGVWLMPISPSPSYHGYDVTDYRGIESDYGTRADFEAFLAAAHARGIRVVVDLVLNHSSSQHPWFTQSASGSGSPYRDWYIWQSTNPGYPGPWGQQVWHLRNGSYYFGLFWGGMPDLNYWNPQVKSAMFDVARFWLDTMGVDGFRLDAIKHLYENGTVMQDVPATFTFLQEYRQFVKGVKADAMTVGEVWSTTTQVAPYADSTRLDFCFEFDLAGAIISGVNSGNPLWVINTMATVLSSYRPLQYAPFLTNHDQDRVFGQLGQDPARMNLAAAVYLTLPGIPFLYYGEEVGMLGSGQDENKRRPMQWTAGPNAGFTTGSPWYGINSNYSTYNVAVMQADTSSLWHWYRRLIRARAEHIALRRGGYAQAATGSSTFYGYARSTTDQLVLVLHNFAGTPVVNPTISLGGSALAAGTYVAEDILEGGSFGTVVVSAAGGFTAFSPALTVGAKGSVLIRLSRMVVAQPVAEGWNLLSLPVRPDNRSASAVYPAALSGAYSFTPETGYIGADTLQTGSGYWLKFGSAQAVQVTGPAVTEDTVALASGWNMVGGLTSDLPAGGLATDPPGLIGSAWFAFSGSGYAETDTLRRGVGYWVKSASPGLLFLRPPGTP
jgi:glycosidase